MELETENKTSPKIQIGSGLDIICLSNFTSRPVQTLSHLTFPSYTGLLEKAVSVNSGVRGLVATMCGSPVALVLFEILSEEATLRSIYVEADVRRSGIGYALMLAMQDTCRAAGCIKLNTSFTSSLPAFTKFNSLLARCNWEQPLERFLFVRGNVKKVWENAEFFKRLPPTPNEFENFLWVDLKPEERKQIEIEIYDRKTIPDILSPFPEEERLEPRTSLGVRYRGKVIGWQINHPSLNETGVLRYTKTYVAAPHQRTARGLMLIRDMGDIHYNTNVREDYPDFVCDVPHENRAMQLFYLRHLGPFAEKMYKSYTSYKKLG